MIDMDSIEKIKDLKENLREEIGMEMRNLVGKFKKYVTIEHPDNPKFNKGEYFVTRINYGVVKHIYPDFPLIFGNNEDDNYYCYLPNHIQFVHNYKLWRSNLIFYNNKSQSWFVCKNDPRLKKSLTEIERLELDDAEKLIEFSSLDTDTQIKMLEMLKKYIYTPSPEAFLEELEQRYGKI